TFVLGSVTVGTSASTTYGGGSACTDVKNGDKRSVAGTKETDGHVLARYVSGAEPPPVPPATPPAPAPAPTAPTPVPPTTPPAAEVTLTGPIAGLAGICPSVTFTVDGTAASADAST